MASLEGFASLLPNKEMLEEEVWRQVLGIRRRSKGGEWLSFLVRQGIDLPPPPFLSSAFLSAGFILRQLSPLLAKTPLSQLQAHIQWGQLRAGSHWTDLGHVSIPEAATGSDPLA